MWNAQSLAEALDSGKYDVKVLGEQSLSVVLKEFAELPIAIVIRGEYMTAEAIIAPCSDVKNSDLFNLNLLKATKHLSLSSFAIDSINGEECYLILGESSATSTIENVELELKTLANNAFEVAELVQEHNKLN